MFSAVRYSVRHLGEDSQFLDSRQMTASQRELALMSWFFQRSPGLRPVSGSVSRKISLASGGSCLISHARSAVA